MPRRDPYRETKTQADRERAHLAIEKAIEDARNERVAAERRKPLHPVWAPLGAGVACGGLGLAFTGNPIVAAVSGLFGLAGVIITRTMHRLSPHGDDPPEHHD